MRPLVPKNGGTRSTKRLSSGGLKRHSFPIRLSTLAAPWGRAGGGGILSSRLQIAPFEARPYFEGDVGGRMQLDLPLTADGNPG